MKTDPKRDLVLERVVDVPPELVWKAWTQPEHVKRWFTPLPWTTVDCEIDVRPGGIFRTVMRSPEGQDHPNLGCFLEVVPGRRLIWTDALEAGFRPSREGPHLPFRFTAMIELEPHPKGTKYTATVFHADEDACAKHAAMGFESGWGTALEQLVAYMKGVRA